MRLSIVRTDKANKQHLTVKSADWLMERIQTDTKAGEIARLRDFVVTFGKADDYDGDATIARIYPAVEMVKTENGNLEVCQYNGLVTLHVGDVLRREDIAAVKEAAAILPMTMAAFTGGDGRSVEILVAVTRKDIPAQPTNEAEANRFYQAAYEVAFNTYRGILPKAIQRQKASARSCFRMTLDAAPFYRAMPTPLQVADGKSTPAPKEGKHHEQLNIDMNLYAVYEQMYARAEETAYAATLGSTPPQTFEAYLTAIASNLCEKGVPEEETFLHLKNHYVFNQAYNEDLFRAIVTTVYASQKTKREADMDTSGMETRRLINLLCTRYVYRHNTVMGYPEYRPNNTWVQEWQPCDEDAINSMTIEARLAGLDVRDKDVRRYVHSNMIRKSNPLIDYVIGASDKWDGVTDHIAMLARCVPCDIPQWEQWFRKWFLSMVAQWMMPGQEYGNSVVPLLISPQGDGKTTFCRMILPKELRWGFLENLDVSEKRQTLQAMHNFLLINLDEFNQISPKLQEGFLKNVIQLPSVKIKRPYGKHVEEFRRYASFIATTNESSVLSDPTGNRRFICVQLTAPVNTAYKPNYEALYGQAYTLIMSHEEQWWFTPEETKAIMDHNRQFELMPPALQYFNEHYEIVDNEEEGEWQSPTAIYERLRRLAGSGLKANGVAAFGRYLRNVPGLRHKRVANGRMYLVREKSSRY